jgi:hypothetical protein
MQAIRKSILIKPNTFIGGVSSTINTPALLATKLAISVSRIRAFRVVGADIEFAVTGGNYIIGSAFEENTNMTYFDDRYGLVLTITDRAFKGSLNVASIKLPGLTAITGSNDDAAGAFWDCQKLTELLIPNVTTITGFNTFRNTFLLTTLNIEKLVSMTTVRMFKFSGLTSLNLPLLTTMQQEAFENNSMTSINIPKFTTSITARVFTQLKVTHLYLPSLVNVPNKQSYFKNMPNIALIDAKKLKVFGNPADNGGGVNNLAFFIAFINSKPNLTINVHIDLATANAGTADVGLIWAKDNINATVNFYDDNGNYVSTL